MSAILFGSIGTIADTSEVQRDAFNKAFAAHGLDRHWDRADYLAMLEQSGGQQRIAGYAKSVGQDVDAAAVHRAKTEFFQQGLAESPIAPRAGVVDTIHGARREGVRVGLVTTTSQQNIAALLEALQPDLKVSDFDLVVDSSSVERPKPDGAAYTFALESLGERADGCVAIEDNVDGVAAASAAGLMRPAWRSPGRTTPVTTSSRPAPWSSGSTSASCGSSCPAGSPRAGTSPRGHRHPASGDPLPGKEENLMGNVHANFRSTDRAFHVEGTRRSISACATSTAPSPSRTPR
jgi:HAD superfamily hydrolase (TIGR01509 family)